LKPIYHLIATVSYSKGRNKHKTRQWIVTTYESASAIMLHDSKTMQSLSDRIYGKVYKGERKIIIVAIKERKVVGYTNYSDE